MVKGSPGRMRGNPLFWVLFGLCDLLVIVALLWFFWLQPQWKEVTESQRPEESVIRAESIFTLPEDSPYQITKTFDLLDYHVVRLDHRVYRQGYVVVTGVRRELYEHLIDSGLDPKFLEQTANSLLKVRDPKNPDRLNIEALQVTGNGRVLLDNAQVNYQQVWGKFHTDKKPESRSVKIISGTLTPNATPAPSRNLTIIVSYGASEDFQPEAYEAFVKAANFKCLATAK